MQSDWEIWTDMHISPIIAKWLNENMGLRTKSSYILNLNGLDDLDIYKMAKAYGKVIILTKDSDFPVIVNRLGTPPKIISLNIGNCSNRQMWLYLRQNIEKAIDTLITEDIPIIELE